MRTRTRRFALWSVSLAAVTGLVLSLSLRERELPRPAPARHLVLVFGPTPTQSARMPALEQLGRGGRGLDGAFAPHPDSATSRESVLGGRPRIPPSNAQSIVGNFAARGFTVGTFGEGVPGLTGEGTDRAGFAPAAAFARFVADHAGGQFLAVVGLPPSMFEEGWRPASAEGDAGELPRIAVGDLEFGARPQQRFRPRAWAASSRLRAMSLHMEACRRADASLGALLTDLQRSAPDATVVYVGDPVPDAGDHGLLERRDALFDETLRSVVVVHGPGLAPRRRSFGEPKSTLGVAATLLDLAGIPHEAADREPSLLPRLLGRPAEPEPLALSCVTRQAGRMGRSLRTRDYRYTEWPDGSVELFDHRADPGEERNVAGVATHASALADLRARMGAAETVAEAPRPPQPGRVRRVIVLIVDDLKTELGAWGAPVETPAMDRLASRGVRFSHAYATVAMCSPSRSAFLLGQRPQTTGIWDNDSVVRPPGVAPIQEVFHAHGFRTASVGKIYHDPGQFSWDVNDAGLSEDTEHLEDGDSPRQGARASLAEPVDGDDYSQPDGRRARRAAMILAEHASERLFLALGLVRPHRRWIAPRTYFERYPPALVRLPEEARNAAATIPAIAIKTRAQWFPGVSLLGREPPGMIADPSFRREAVAAYRACVSFADAQVDRVLDVLDAQNLWRDSVVVLVGDNGYHLGDHGGLFRKDTLFEEALHVPLIVVAPGVPAGRVVDAPVGLLGLYRTLLDLAGIPADQATPGSSLAPRARERNLRGPGSGVVVPTGACARCRLVSPHGRLSLYDLARRLRGVVRARPGPRPTAQRRRPC